MDYSFDIDQFEGGARHYASGKGDLKDYEESWVVSKV
jgi:hypothetical protein